LRIALATIFGSLMLFMGIPAAMAAETMYTPIADWQPQLHDRFVVDITTNMGYLVHDNGEFTQFEVATGQLRWVRYIGLSYFAATPERRWEARTYEIKGDRTTFGKDGIFIRLYYKNEKTNYGIHAYKNDGMITDENGELYAAKNRYGSMGCIVPRHTELAIIEQTFNLNNGLMYVITKKGVQDPYVEAFKE
jgi:hypothetical protein